MRPRYRTFCTNLSEKKHDNSYHHHHHWENPTVRQNIISGGGVGDQSSARWRRLHSSGGCTLMHPGWWSQKYKNKQRDYPVTYTSVGVCIAFKSPTSLFWYRWRRLHKHQWGVCIQKSCYSNYWYGCNGMWTKEWSMGLTYQYVYQPRRRPLTHISAHKKFACIEAYNYCQPSDWSWLIQETLAYLKNQLFVNLLISAMHMWSFHRPSPPWSKCLSVCRVFTVWAEARQGRQRQIFELGSLQRAEEGLFRHL